MHFNNHTDDLTKGTDWMRNSGIATDVRNRGFQFRGIEIPTRVIANFFIVGIIAIITYYLYKKLIDNAQKPIYKDIVLFFCICITTYGVNSLLAFYLSTVSFSYETLDSYNPIFLFPSCFLVALSLLITYFVYLEPVSYICSAYLVFINIFNIFNKPQASYSLFSKLGMYATLLLMLMLLGVFFYQNNIGDHNKLLPSLNLMLSHSLILLLVFAMTSIFQFFQIGNLLIVFENATVNPLDMFVCKRIFLFSFSYFLINFSVQKFTVELIKTILMCEENGDKILSKRQKMLCVLKTLVKDIKHVLLPSITAALCQTVCSIVYISCLELNKANHPLLVVFSCFIGILIGTCGPLGIFVIINLLGESFIRGPINYTNTEKGANPLYVYFSAFTPTSLTFSGLQVFFNVLFAVAFYTKLTFYNQSKLYLIFMLFVILSVSFKCIFAVFTCDFLKKNNGDVFDMDQGIIQSVNDNKNLTVTINDIDLTHDPDLV